MCSLIQLNCISIDLELECFCFMVPWMMPWVVLLSVVSSVGGYGWPRSMQHVQSGTASLAFIDRLPILASAADSMTFFDNAG